MRNERAVRWIPSRHTESVKGFANLHKKGSISCVSASIPVLAVIEGGSEYVSSESTTASRGSISGLRRLTLILCSGETRTALRVTSQPVPDVVGMQMHGAQGCVR